MRDPMRFECAHVTAWVGDDALLPWPGGGRSLLVAQQAGLPASAPAAENVQIQMSVPVPVPVPVPAPVPVPVLYCDVMHVRIDELFL